MSSLPPPAPPPAYHAPSLLPQASETALKHHFLGRRLQDVQAPAVVLDAAVVRRNCKLMLETARELGVGFRAHVKTHKTTQLAKLQVGEDSRSVKLVASTVAEIENLMPWLAECKRDGKEVNVIYGLPVAQSALPRLAAVARILGPNTVSLFVDHPTHIRTLETVSADIWPGKIPVFVKIDTGYHRAGVAVGQGQLSDLAYALKASSRTSTAGFYAHMGHSYGAGDPQEALKFFTEELQGLEQGALEFMKCTGATASRDATAPKVVLSLGATPTATATQNIVDGCEGASEYRALLARVAQSFAVELHAGEHALARRFGLRALVEVVSVYDERGQPEAMIAAGSIVLGREPCKSYPGWGVVTAWPEARAGQVYDAEGERTGWIVGRISQEHGVLTWQGEREGMRVLEIGQKLLLWPNHACMCGPSFGWYLVVDSETGDGDVVVDVWTRWRGW
ncbi:hypothetical protein Q7P37_008363 [Cladosporium fusiforme]